MLHVSCWQFNCQSAETAPDFRQPNDWRKRWDLVSRRNVSSEEAALVYKDRTKITTQKFTKNVLNSLRITALFYNELQTQ